MLGKIGIYLDVNNRSDRVKPGQNVFIVKQFGEDLVEHVFEMVVIGNERYSKLILGLRALKKVDFTHRCL